MEIPVESLPQLMHEVLGIIKRENFGTQTQERRHREVLKFSVKTQLIYEPTDLSPHKSSSS